MEAGRLFEKTRSWSKLLFFIPFTIALFAFAVFLSPFLTKNYVKGEGIITNVEKRTEYDSDNVARTVYDTAFTYTIDGKGYDQTYSLSEQKAVGEKITFYYDPQDPQKTTNSMNNAWLWLVFLGLGTVSAIFTVYTAVKDRKRRKQTDALRAQKAETERRAAQNGFGIPEAGELKEYYFRFDGHTLKPGYLIENESREPVFEGKMLKNNPFAAKEYEFINHRTGRSTVHKIGHTVTSGSGDSEFSTSSGFKFDGVNVWDYLHDQGILISSGMGGKLNMKYEITRNGHLLAYAEMTGQYVHEDEAEKKKINLTNRMFYRIRTDAEDLEPIFLVLFAIAETDQIVYS